MNYFKFKKMISYYKPYKKVFFWDLFFSFLSSVVILAIPIIVRYITEKVILMPKEKALKNVIMLGVLMIFLLLVFMASHYFMIHKGHLIGAKMERDMRSELFDHYQKLSFSFYDERKIGDLLSRVSSDLSSIGDFLHHIPEEVFLSILRIIGAFVIFFYINWRLALYAIAIFPIMIIYLKYFIPKTFKIFTKERKKVSDVNSQLEETISGIRTVKSFGNEKLEKSKFEFENNELVSIKDKGYELMAKTYSGLVFFMNSMMPIITIAGLLLSINGYNNPGDLLAFILCQSVIVGPIYSLIERFEKIQESIAGFDRFLEILSIKPKITDPQDCVELENVKGNITFKDVCFKYNSKKESVFKNLDLNIKAGEFVALVGSSGVGKSTLCNLILRFYDISSGQILIDEKDVRKIKTKDLRENIGYVQQDTFLFSGSIIENIKYGKRDATESEVIEAAKNANAHEFIMNLPEKYNTSVGQKGMKLSGGQKQRISIARVFLKNPSILIFDEATSSLDSESEKCIRKSLEKLSENRTTIVIAHRLSTIKKAERILVLSQGRISEEGKHEKLLSKNGLYSEFYRLL
ncbi:MAG: ABC transporter ATP-binding protein/permease [Oscillospiraceae bacterium]|nr:ABC transporter ATP-binding protein/permease [Oscillospiraceae bacterium]